jgi:hypothetical protein
MDYVRNLRTGQWASIKTSLTSLIWLTIKKTMKTSKRSGIFSPFAWEGAVDGVGGTVKRCASHAILQAVEECTMKTPFEMFEWAKNNINVVQFGYVDNTKYEKHKQFL